jgi:hypothetical protein
MSRQRDGKGRDWTPPYVHLYLARSELLGIEEIKAALVELVAKTQGKAVVELCYESLEPAQVE